MSLPLLPAGKLPSHAPEQRWLVEQLWGAEAVGIIGGEPKCGKSFLALDLAVSVASGTACLGRFRAARAARVLLYAAEDPLHVVRERLEGITVARGVALPDLPLFVITAPSLRLDHPDHCERLWETVEKIHPALLVLDPFVRLHTIERRGWPRRRGRRRRDGASAEHAGGEQGCQAAAHGPASTIAAAVPESRHVVDPARSCIALGLLVLIVWWTMFHRPRRKPPEDR